MKKEKRIVLYTRLCGMTSNKLEKKINGNWTIKEIIEAMKALCPEAWIDDPDWIDESKWS